MRLSLRLAYTAERITMKLPGTNSVSIILITVALVSGYVEAYTCTDGLVIDDENVCDFREDCSDGIDEATCPSTCSFEDGFCNWYNVTDPAEATLVWTLFVNDEPEWYYGPPADHTLNSVQGHYLYVDDTYTTKGQKAILRSPEYQMAARGCMFTFWYYVYGVDFGTLKLFQYTPSNDRYYTLLTAVDRGEDKSTTDRWNFFEIQVEACAESFRLSIVAEDTNEYKNTGGYAIDDLRFENCAYTLPLAPGETCGADYMPCDSGHCFPIGELCDYTLNCCDGTDESFSNCVDYNMCDFETGMCDWEHLSDGTYNWKRDTGGTGTSYTGPWIDHTTFSNDGYYVYTEADGALPGDTYRLGSLYLQAVTSGCEMRFYYHMRGSGMGELNVYTRTMINGPFTFLWNQDEAQGNFWVYQSLTLSSPDAFQVIFEGVRGSSNSGDIALDDISFTPGCLESPDPLPDFGATPTPKVKCADGQRVCDLETCIDEAKYCDFRTDCLLGGEDERYCPSHCNFDSVDYLGECYWSQDVNDDFDWSWYNSGDMAPDFAGPTTDHNTGTTFGHYMFVDGTTSSINTFAKLISPVYKKAGRGCSFNMWYYMFGPEYGDLEVRLTTLDGLDIRLTKVGDDALDYNKWILSESEIPACTTDFHIVVEAEDRQQLPVESGFAVDDVNFVNCAYPEVAPPGECGLGLSQCSTGECYPSENQCDFTKDCCDGSDEIPQTCNQLGYNMCDFESDFCLWSQLDGDDFDWRRHQGDTGTESSGPTKDHTTGTDEGYYVYTEVSDRRMGDAAWLGSYTIAGSILSTCTMTFFYHMRGTGMGTLNVYTRTEINGPLDLVWTKSNDQENYWYEKSLDFYSTSDYQIIFEGIKGTTAYGDIALDDISLTPNCLQSPSDLPGVTTPPPTLLTCPSGQLPCNGQCISEEKYCDFRHDCLPGEEDEAQCPVYCSLDETMCFWTQDQSTDNFDWMWYHFDDGPTEFNGPNYDHTTGAATGHYIYVDGSISSIDGRAKLLSPMYKKAKRGCTFTFYYYMFGIEYGDLEVHLRAQDGEETKLTKANDDALDYNKWLLHVTEIPPCSANFQVILDAEDRQVLPSEGGFAVDDLMFQNCAFPTPEAECGIGEGQCSTGECYPAAQRCDFTPDCCDFSDENKQECINDGYSMCDFESGMCDWDQLQTDEFDWSRQKGGTGSSGTGPSSDHTTGSGYYLYTEASGSRRNGDRAQLASFTIFRTVTGQCSLRFYYHMEGRGIGTLIVYLRTSQNAPMTVLWSEDRSVGGEWMYHTIPLRSTSDFQVIIEGVIGYTTNGDIGLDDVILTPGCVRTGGPLPGGTTLAPTGATCPSGLLPCNDGCINENQYCDFIHNCMPGNQDEAQCPIYCSLEDDLCFWTQDQTDEFDWTWYDHSEDSDYKGPTNDHTTGAAAGRYIYVDGSTSARDQRAKLVSPMYKKAKRGCVFTFYYFMFGIEYGDLEVRLVTQDGQDYRLTKANDDAFDYNKWLLHETEIPPCTTDFQVVIDAEDRQYIPSEGGFAVDDLLFQDCAYPPPVLACGAGKEQCSTKECYPAAQRCDYTPDCCDLSDENKQECINDGYSMCDFETGLCDWSQLNSDEFDWTRRKGSTSSDNTGPSSDHTTGSGYFLYTEASNPARNGDRAQLASFTITRTLTGSCALRFYYHMDGIGIGTLTVYTRTQVGGPKAMLWTKERAIGGEWVYQSIPLRSNDDFQVVIEGVIGYTTKGDIGLDDVTLTPDCQRSTTSLPVVTTMANVPTARQEPTIPTSWVCPPGYFQCSGTGSGKCVDEDNVCNGVDDCADGSDEDSCSSSPNVALIVGLSVTFGVLAIAVIVGGVLYMRQQDQKKKNTNPFGSPDIGIQNPSYVLESKTTELNEFAFSMDRSDA